MVWDPFEDLERMHDEIDRMFNRMWGTGRPQLGYRGTDDTSLIEGGDFRSPVCHVQETEKNIQVSFEVPGVNKKDIDLRVNDDNITVKVDSKVEKEQKDEDKKTYSYAMQSQSFYRKVPLPKEVDSDKAKAEYKNGVLRVEAPKKYKEKQKGKRVDIQ